MLFGDIVALIVALDISYEGLEVEIREQILHLEHDVFEELIIHLWSTREHGEIGTMLGQAPIHHSIVFIISRNDLLL